MQKHSFSIWEKLKSEGYSRREFLQFCGYISAAMGLDASGLTAIQEAMETKPRPPVVWFHFQECTCCSESFIKSSHPTVANVVLDKISLDYTETLQVASGFQAEEALHRTMEEYRGEYIMLVEGSVPTKDGGIYCTIAGRTALDILKDASQGAKAVIAWGSCASNGCVQSSHPNPTGATPVHKILKHVVRVPGCPPIGEVMMGLIVHILAFGRLPQLDSQQRPKAFYSTRVHDSCYRRPYYDAGLFVETFDDSNAKKGYCLYKMGCRGPTTYNSCGIIRWNNGTSYPIQSGTPCIGCSENGYFDNAPLYNRLPAFPGFGIETTADDIGAMMAAAAAGGIAVHTVLTNIRKRKIIKEELEKSLEGKDIDSQPDGGGE